MVPLGHCRHTLLSTCAPVSRFIQIMGLKNFLPPVKIENIEYPERNRLRMVPKVPQYPAGMKPMKMQKRLRYMRGPEEVLNTFIHKQFGIVAVTGGRMRYGHFEMARLTLGRKLDYDKMFVIWRIDPPWQPVTKKSQGHRMGGGKGSIDHYVTPVKAGRVILEVGGNCEFFEVQRVMTDVANKLPFKAIAVSQEILDKQKEEEKRLEEENQHLWTWKYMIQNNIGGCHNWISPSDKRWFNKYL